ncbi:flagellar hook-associated protein FlgK [Paenibacillus sp. FSL K6-1230]|uniref:flagellar hook-associated protein FlgK n=1 Tax=Paenibacillus sp. FSL K6-1230 TaxID=2921603 RepID=UPI0030F7D1EE
MRSTFHNLEIGKRGVIAQQTALSTTGHNITNTNTEGYSRQVARLTASIPIEFPSMTKSTNPNQLGMGVEVDSIRRVRNYLMDIEFRNQNSTLSTWKTKQEALGKIEGIINEPSEDSIATVISDFWNSWQDLSKNPSSSDLSARTIVQQKAVALTETFNHVASQLNVLSNNLTDQLNSQVNDVNAYADQIAAINYSIKRIEAMGDNANDLRDKRDLLVDKLSELGNIQVIETDDAYTVNFGGMQLINDDVVTPFNVANVGAITQGAIAGTVQSRDVHVAEYTRQLDIMANTLANGKISVTLPAGSILPVGVTIPNAVMDPTNPRKLAQDTPYEVDGLNGLHKLGYTLQSPATAGQNFFVTSDNSVTITAANIRVNSNIINDAANIAASMRTEIVTNANGTTTEKVLQGNGGLALLIAGLSEGKFSFDPLRNNGAITDVSTFGGYLQSVIAQLGTDADLANKMVENNTLLTNHSDNLRASVSSVSLDEEMADLIRFQQAYSASARVITTVDEMLDKLINGTGVVGR